ncbi:MAG: DUF3135 domain-containing protein [Pseudomonadota bacterium]
MKEVEFNTLDFDSMSLIAKDDPEEFERLRQEAIDEFIESAPLDRRDRLRCLQWRIDQERRNCSPLSACLKISKMMWDHLMSTEGLLGRQNQLMFPDAPVDTVPAKVISFPINSGHH